MAILGHFGGRLVGPIDALQRGRSDFMSGRRPRIWCDVRGLRAVALSSVGCGQLGCAALLLVGSGGMSGRRPRKAVPVDCAGREGAVDVGAAAPRESLWRPDFCGNDDGGSDVGNAAMVVIVGSSPACPRYYLGLFVAMESKLRRRGPVVYDDWLHVAFRRSSVTPAVPGFVLLSFSSESELRCLSAGRHVVEEGQLCPVCFTLWEWARPLLFRFFPSFP